MHKGDTWLQVRHVTFGPRGERLAYAVRSEEGWAVVLDGKRSEFFDEVGAPRFSPDGATCVFGARLDRELWWKVHLPAADAGGSQEDATDEE